MCCHGPYLRWSYLCWSVVFFLFLIFCVYVVFLRLQGSAHGKAGGSHRHRRRQRCLHRSRCLGLGQGGRFRLVCGLGLPATTDSHQVAFGHCPSAARATVGCWEGPGTGERPKKLQGNVWTKDKLWRQQDCDPIAPYTYAATSLYYLLLLFWLFSLRLVGERWTVAYHTLLEGQLVSEFTDLGPADGRRWLTSSIKFLAWVPCFLAKSWLFVCTGTPCDD